MLINPYTLRMHNILLQDVGGYSLSEFPLLSSINIAFLISLLINAHLSIYSRFDKYVMLFFLCRFWLQVSSIWVSEFLNLLSSLLSRDFNNLFPMLSINFLFFLFVSKISWLLPYSLHVLISSFTRIIFQLISLSDEIFLHSWTYRMIDIS